MGKIIKRFIASLLVLVFSFTFSSWRIAASDALASDQSGQTAGAFSSFSELKTWADDAYFFPHAAFRNPDGWKKMSYEEQGIAQTVPSELLESMSTKGLILTCLYYPEFFSIYAYNSYQLGFESLVQRTNCIQELYKRDDSTRYLTELYL